MEELILKVLKEFSDHRQSENMTYIHSDYFESIANKISALKSQELSSSRHQENDELFKKVYINSVDDLPKSGVYECYFNDYTLGRATYDSSDQYATTGKVWWINKVVWYLQPIQQEVQPSEGVGNSDINRVMDYLEGKVVSGMELSEALEISELLLILNKYASQLPKSVTDDELQDNAFNRARELEVKGKGQRVSFYNGYIEGAKAYRDGLIKKI